VRRELLAFEEGRLFLLATLLRVDHPPRVCILCMTLTETIGPQHFCKLPERPRCHLLGFAYPPLVLITSDELLERELDAAVFVDDDPLCELFRPLEDCGQEAAEAVAPLVGAYYDPNKGRITLPVDGDRLTPYDQAILAHELTHSLTDGHFRSSTQRAELWENGDTDAAAALKALVEGDANYVMALYIDQYPESNALDDTTVDSNEEAAADPLPALEWARLWFTYGQGWSYVRTLVEGGGLAAVNDAYADPVRSTEQVLSGPRLAAGPPVVVDAELPDPPVGYELYETGEWGARDWYLLLWDDPDAIESIAGWGGASYAVYRIDFGEWLLHIRHVSPREIREVGALLVDLLEPWRRSRIPRDRPGRTRVRIPSTSGRRPRTCLVNQQSDAVDTQGGL
jgi:hypothetical protein